MNVNKEKKVVRIVSSRQKREQRANAREGDLRIAEREREEEIAALGARKAAVLKSRQLALHKSGKQRARVIQRGGELEIESGEELWEDIPPQKTSLDDVMCEEMQPPPTNDATTCSGERISAEAGLLRVLGALCAPGDCSQVSAEDLKEQIAIDLLDPTNAAFKVWVMRSSAVCASFNSASVLLLKKATPFQLESQSCLLHLFKNRIPSGGVLSGNGQRVYAISEEEIDGAYNEVTANVDWAIHARVIAAYKEDDRNQWRILIPRMPWAAGCKELAALWKACPRPQSDRQLREAAVAAGVRPLLHINTVEQRNKVHKERADRVDALKQPMKKKAASTGPRLPGLVSAKKSAAEGGAGALLFASRGKTKAKKPRVPVLMAKTASTTDGGNLSDVFD
tara:strand:+ start:5874 stop:7058 length:1185 start_codon:yes stop_codon:yes gene_type:complete